MWEERDNNVHVYKSDNFKSREKYRILILDLDGTLTARKNGKNPSYPDPDPDNWLFLGDVPKVLNDYKRKKYNIFILTNQGWGDKYKNIILDRMNNIKNKLLEINGWTPFFIVVNSKDKSNIYRKPNIGSLKIIKELLNISDNSNISKIIISGDAIGSGDEYPPYQYADTDKKYYENVFKNYNNVTFIRPLDLFPSNKEELIQDINEDVVIMMGNPGSGKSTFAKELSEEKGYVHMEKDIMNLTSAKYKKYAEECLNNNKKIIIDMTNTKVENREIWITLANKHNLTSAIVWSIISGQPFNNLRTENKISSIVYNVYSKNFQEPTENETKIYKLY